ncbi:hypothetical protein C1N83_17375 [Priestia aryabhattai]
MRPLISIIVPVYKVEKYISNCIESLLAQTYRNIEIILVNDGSPDNSPQICDNFAKKDSRVSVIHTENGGQARARNIGLDIAKGEYIGFVDSDDVVSPVMYELLYTSIVKYNADAAGCMSTSNLNELDCPTNIPSYKPNVVCITSNPLRYYLSGEGHAVWRRLYKASLFSEVRFNSVQHDEDVLISYELMRNCNKYVKLNEKLYFWNKVPPSLSRGPIKTLVNQSRNIYEIVKDEMPESEEIALLRAIQTEYRFITRAIRFGFANKSIEKEYKINLKLYLKNLKSNMKVIKKSTQFRRIDVLQIRIMTLSLPLFTVLYKSTRKILNTVRR